MLAPCPGAFEIGVATPYRGQKKLLEDHMKDKAFVRFFRAFEELRFLKTLADSCQQSPAFDFAQDNERIGS